MALRDVDLSVRVTALSVIAVIDKTGILQDEDEEPRDKVARLMFDHEPRVRKAVGGFVHGMWEEKATKLKTDWAGARGSKKKRGAGIVEGEMNAMLEWKALATLLVDTANALEGPAAEASTSKQSSLVPASSQSMTRATAAVEAIWERFEALQEWEKLVDYLLLDHSTAEQDMWLLNDDEEDFVIQVLIACIKKEDKVSLSEPSVMDRAEPYKEDQLDARTKTLMKILPRLFTKHQADTARMAGILSIPEHMNLGVYLDMRKSSVSLAALGLSFC